MHRANSTRRNRDATHKRFRELNERTGAALQEHAQAALLKRKATLRGPCRFS
jgi:hypothetical protein